MARNLVDQRESAMIAALDRRVHWLSAWMIHHANHVRENRDGIKVGGHQASSASLATTLSSLYFGVLRPQDRVAVKPHASPALHAIEYLLGRQSRDQLEKFRGFGGAQSYPSRTKDKIRVDFSTGSVGLGVAITSFAAMVQDYLLARQALPEARRGRMIALMGDAELDEGNIYEALLEGAKYGLRDTWWIIDYNRQSLDAVVHAMMHDRFIRIFQACDWQVHTLKYGRKLEAAFAEPGGQSLRAWIDQCPNDRYSALTFQGGAAWREQLTADLDADGQALIARYDDASLADLMTNLAGHDVDLLLETFRAIDDDRPQLFLIYTIKGYGLPFAGHKDNHAGLMTLAQMAQYREQMQVREGREWEPLEGVGNADALRGFLDQVAFTQPLDLPAAGPVPEQVPEPVPEPVPVPEALPCPTDAAISTQVAFGRILNDLGKGDSALADHILTTSPDVTVSTNLGGWVNQRGRFARADVADFFKDARVMSPQKWAASPAGQHLELGIAEHNLFLALAAFGLAHDLFGHRLFPIGTLYDPFINRGLDALNYACYQDARFIVVATPSGITLGPEGGAHQSIHPPVIGMAQDKLSSFEPAFADELAAILRWSFEHLQAADGGSIYLRLSTRVLDQPSRPLDAAAVIAGGYWAEPPAHGAPLAIAYTGALAPEARQAYELLREDIPGLGLLAVTSADRLHRGWRQETEDLASGAARPSWTRQLLAPLAPRAGLITMIDGAPSALSWLGSVRGQPVVPLGVDCFGQTGDLPDLYAAYRLDADAVLDAAASLLIQA
ncbi:MAG: transketolase [Rhodothalassiaceae bacterium]